MSRRVIYAGRGIVITAAPGATTTMFSQQFPLGGACALCLVAEIPVLQVLDVTMRVSIQLSNDGVNWTDFGGSVSTTDQIGCFSVTNNAIASRFARLSYQLTNLGIAAGVSIASARVEDATV